MPAAVIDLRQYRQRRNEAHAPAQGSMGFVVQWVPFVAWVPVYRWL
jgi:hypothetical protein